MLFLNSVAAPTRPDYVALAMVLMLLLVVAVMAIRKHLSRKTPPAAAVAPSAEEVPESPQTPVAPGTAGQLKLHDVSPKTAAMLMAIVANTLNKPLNELRFISIKEVK